MWPAIIGMGIGATANIISNSAQAKAINEKIRRAQALMAENIVDSGELASRLHAVDRMFNQRLTSVLNTTAIRARGYANQGTIGAAAAGNVEGERLYSKTLVTEDAYKTNKDVRQQIGMLELETTTPDPLAAGFSGAVSGFGAGLEYMKMENAGNIDVPPDKPGENSTTLTQASNMQSNPNFINAGFGSYNPTGFYKTGLGTWQSSLASLRAIDDDDLYNFYLPGTWDIISGNLPKFKLGRTN